MTNQNVITRSGSNSSRSFMHDKVGSNAATTIVANEDPSPTGTEYYSLDTENETKQTLISKRQDRHDNDSQEDPTVALRRKQSRIHEPTDDEPVNANSLAHSLQESQLESRDSSPQPKSSTESFVPTEPDWTERPHCFAFLQSLNPKYPDKYLMKKKNDTDNRAGYVIGRSADCDIPIKQNEISRHHCLIYMETGATDKAKGIRIYLQDTSFNGTFVNTEKIGRGERILLRAGDRIQLYRRARLADDDMKHTFYRVCFPPVFEANTCEHNYEFTTELGKGNFATVYHALQKDTNIPVAIKVMQKSRFERKPKLFKSILTEISIMNKIEKHPFLVQYKETYSEQTRAFLVLEYVRDGELFNYIRDSKKLSENETRFIFWQLFTAIEYLHKCRIVHRDLKPENVLLADKKKLHIKVSDFGLANLQDRNSVFSSQCGTPNYVAPEILDPSEVRGYNEKCDLWSLGVMLYICLCGYPPFSEENGPPSMKAQIKMGKYVFLSPYWDNVSKDAKDLINELLTVDPVNRASATEALDHPWMKINPDELEERKKALGAEPLAQVYSYSTRESVPDTQMAMSQSQSLSLNY